LHGNEVNQSEQGLPVNDVTITIGNKSSESQAQDRLRGHQAFGGKFANEKMLHIFTSKNSGAFSLSQKAGKKYFVFLAAFILERFSSRKFYDK
jgi:hypothetical protein